METSEAERRPETLGANRAFVFVWAALLVFTAITVAVAQLRLGALGTSVAVLIATAKSSLVLWFFMGMRRERSPIRWMMFAAIVTFGIFFALTYLDYWTR